MPGKAKAALFGALIGAVMAVVIEAFAAAESDETFFGSTQSWVVLVLLVVGLSWSQKRAYEKKSGIYGDRDAINDQTD
ncbi:hypothetical protein GCM10023190_04840 [Enteractinococcus fodinae]|uniref:Branched-subunit amino acid ABC-type transport system permease component n=1 Tax=Enteractinococcus fodinae TaxID=684663 RepID=A0ABU2B0A7_9MICC|nr:hypothetical protein [Enteractinococcus fodinae]MDR7347037.1 branched-subunit amino acid ABC-type transport system permease component [Enteractinococcus fodinae]